MYVVWKKRKLSAARRGPQCHHGAAHRYALKPVIVRSAPGAPQEYEVVARLPAFRSCCRRDPAARAAWWAEVDPLLDRLRRRCRLRRQEVDLPRLERALRLRIPRPAPHPRPHPTDPPLPPPRPRPPPRPAGRPWASPRARAWRASKSDDSRPISSSPGAAPTSRRTRRSTRPPPSASPS